MEAETVVNALMAFILFSLNSSAIYLINDIVDIDKDRLHPRKKMRSLAAGKITVKQAALTSVAMAP